MEQRVEQRGAARRLRRRLSAGFKRDAVNLVRTSGKPIAQMAGELGVGDSTLGNWVRQDQIDRGEREGLSSDERAELLELRRENARSGDGPWAPNASCGLLGEGVDRVMVLSLRR